MRIAHGEQPIACHQTIPPGTSEIPDADVAWAIPGLRQCRGAAIFRANVCKSPRNPTDAEHSTEPDEDLVFASDREFIGYHTGTNDDPSGG